MRLDSVKVAQQPWQQPRENDVPTTTDDEPSRRESSHSARPDVGKSDIPLPFDADALVVALDRLEELSADVVLQGGEVLTEAETAELRTLRRLLPAEADRLSHDLAAACGAVAGVGPGPDSRLIELDPKTDPGAVALPEEVRARTVGRLNGLARKVRQEKVARDQRWMSKLGLTGWLVAAVAVFGAGYLALELRWLSDRTIGIGPLMAMMSPVEHAADDSTVSHRLAHDEDSVSLWLDSVDETHPERGARLIWSDRLQAGLVEVLGLPANDPTRSQYQLWVVDAERPHQARRVPAGLFNVKNDGGPTVTTLIVRPTLPVGHAVAFAVTREPAGGSTDCDWGDRLVLHVELPDDEQGVATWGRRAAPHS
ncbi:MAG: anti-sigma factor [Planctomycetota bacterium]